MGKLLIFLTAVFLALIFIILLSASVYASGYNFFVYNPASIERQALAEIPSPNIKSVFAYPDKVMPGQVLLITAEVESVYPVKSAVAIFENENQPIEMNMLLISGTKNKGIYETRWIAHDTLAQKWYNTTIIFTDILGKKSMQEIAWQDPTVTHKADEITAGTFGAGDYTFPGNLTVNNAITLNLTSSPSNNTGYAKLYYKAAETVIDSYTKLLLHMDGTDASTTFTDSETTPKSVTANGNAQIDTAQSKFGGASGLFDGDSDYLTVPDSDDWYFGAGDFTIDGWVRFNDLTNVPAFIGQTQEDGENFWWIFKDPGASSQISIRFIIGGVTEAYYYQTSNWAPNLNQWYHIAAVRSGTSILLFIDGVSSPLTGQIPISTNDVGNVAASLHIGRGHPAGVAYYLNGWLDEVRISKGIARWTSNFNVPTSAYADVLGGLVFQYQNGSTKLLAGE
jgi:hypothetical protein